MNFLKNKMQTAAACLFAATMMVNFSACSDEIDDTLTEEPQTTFTGFGAAADNYNINDGEFTANNWYEQEAIYLYDGIGQDKTDPLGRAGYTLVNLPWHQGDMQSNLPNGFCKDINRENGWELVLNRCGSRSIKNNNFIALYNNYTGTLRFFYYQPENFQTGNDHVWEVKMTDNMAQNSTLRYSVPQDRSIKHKDEIGQTTTDNTIVEYIAPWVGSLSQDGLITPNAGWWAFDVDLSLYSGHGTRDDAMGHSPGPRHRDGQEHCQHVRHQDRGCTGYSGHHRRHADHDDDGQHRDHRPRTWALYGRETVNEAWTLLDRQETAAAGGVPTANALSHTNMTAKGYQLNASTASNMRYFRFEVLNTWDNGENSYMQLGELKLNFTAPTN